MHRFDALLGNTDQNRSMLMRISKIVPCPVLKSAMNLSRTRLLEKLDVESQLLRRIEWYDEEENPGDVTLLYMFWQKMFVFDIVKDPENVFQVMPV